jgi:hypothetical protein
MMNDVVSTAKSLQATLEFVATNNQDAYKNTILKEKLGSLQIGKTG